jgi:hypothetical protein
LITHEKEHRELPGGIVIRLYVLYGTLEFFYFQRFVSVDVGSIRDDIISIEANHRVPGKGAQSGEQPWDMSKCAVFVKHVRGSL